MGGGLPNLHRRATTVASIIVTHIIPRFGMPTSFQSDNGPEFTSQITQTIIKALNIPWQFHIPYHPSSSGKVDAPTIH
jgi:transposase InsO family protein